MDYTKLVALAKKTLLFLEQHHLQQFEFPYQDLGRAIRKPLHKRPVSYIDGSGNKKYFRTSLINPQVLKTIQKCFVVLQDLGYVTSFKFEHVPAQDNYFIQVTTGDESRGFDEVIKHSIYYPITGEKQQLSDDLHEQINSQFTIDYKAIMAEQDVNDYAQLSANLRQILPLLWLDKYKAMTKTQTNVHEISRHFTFMFDLQLQIDQGDENTFVEDRVVACWGMSKKSVVKRDATRMAGYLKGVFNWTDKNTDKGHFIGHSLGGGVDENLFPQRKDINRGLSERGKVYRVMEQYCADNPGTFCFARPIYCDFSTRPFMLEYGVLKKDGSLWVELFDNV